MVSIDVCYWVGSLGFNFLENHGSSVTPHKIPKMLRGNSNHYLFETLLSTSICVLCVCVLFSGYMIYSFWGLLQRELKNATR